MNNKDVCHLYNVIKGEVKCQLSQMILNPMDLSEDTFFGKYTLSNN